MSSRIAVALVLTLAFLSTANAKQDTKFRDFSRKGPEYAALENLRFAAGDIRYSGPETAEILERQYPGLKYHLTATVTVETSDAIGATYTSTYEKYAAQFEILVVDDRERTIHDAWVKQMYSIWKKKELYSGDYYFDFHAKDKCYAIAAVPANQDRFYFVWVNGRAIKIAFKGFVNRAQAGAGAIYDFTADRFRISIDNTYVKAYEYPLQPRKRFVRLYEEGFFRSPASCR